MLTTQAEAPESRCHVLMVRQSSDSRGQGWWERQDHTKQEHERWEIQLRSSLQNAVCFPSPACIGAQSLQLCLILCDPTDWSLPGSSVHGILQARILEWIAMCSFRGFSRPNVELISLTSPALAGGFFTADLPGKPSHHLPKNSAYKATRSFMDQLWKIT